jgi:hypothetical protein
MTDLDKLYEYIRDSAPQICAVCGGYKLEDSSPKWVYQEEICDCPEPPNEGP